MGLLRRSLGLPRRGWRWAVAWFGLDRKIVLPALLVFTVSGTVGGLAGYEGYRYMWIAPEFCYACHIHDYAVEDWRHSIHGDVVTCHDCHRVPLMHYTKTLLHTFYQRPSFPEDLHHLPRISNETCESCHIEGAVEFEELSSPMPEAVFERIVRVNESPAHLLHMQATTRDPGKARGGSGGAPERKQRLADHGPHAEELGVGTGAIECVDCHGSEANRFHNFFARDDNCTSCHEDLTVRGEHLRQFDCRHCHFQDFLPPYGAVADPHGDDPTVVEDPLLR
jgi:hypothetical protein